MQANRLKVLLLQIRRDEQTQLEEFYEFVQFSGLVEQQFTSLNAYKNADFAPEIMKNYDVLFVGGSSDASVLQSDLYPFVPSCKRLIRYCYENNIPVFASCFGFQLAVEELGGQVILDKEKMEMGIYSIQLTEWAQSDPLLFDYPNDFFAVSGHKERAKTIPDNSVHLAGSELCPYHIIKFIDKPFYCFQFHPEVDRNDLVTRITRYQTRYLSNSDALQAIVESATEDTHHATRLVKDFVDRIILPYYSNKQRTSQKKES